MTNATKNLTTFKLDTILGLQNNIRVNKELLKLKKIWS
jgi:hypothetical protein